MICRAEDSSRQLLLPVDSLCLTDEVSADCSFTKLSMSGTHREILEFFTTQVD